MMEKQMKNELYERSKLTITFFFEEDTIVTSGDTFWDDLGGLNPGDNGGIIGEDPNASPGTWGF